jgi:RNA polymerase primary sigma factor
MTEELGREPSNEELAEELGLATAKVAHLKNVAVRPASLDAKINADDDTAFGDLVSDERAEDPFATLRDKDLREEVGDLLDVLDPRERKIISFRFGLAGGKERTLEEVGRKFGVTRERIRQLQNIALLKMRKALRKREEIKFPEPQPV